MSETVPENPLFAVAVYLVASARDCLDEPLIYGPFRIIEGVSHLIEASSRIPGLSEDQFMTDLKVWIDEQKYNVMADRESFAVWLGDLLARCAAEAKARNLKESAPLRTLD